MLENPRVLLKVREENNEMSNDWQDCSADDLFGFSFSVSGTTDDVCERGKVEGESGGVELQARVYITCLEGGGISYSYIVSI